MLTSDRLSSYNDTETTWKGERVMPTQTFFNLPQEKRERLLAVAKKEFTRVPFSKASINRIIKEAYIPRGSFYMYFEDKEDVYFYLLLQYRDMLTERLIVLLKEYDGNLIKAFRHLQKDVIHYCSDDDRKQYFKNVVLNMNLHLEKRLFDHYPVHPPDKAKKHEEIIKHIRLDDYAFEKKEDINDIIAILFQLLMNSIMPVLLLECSASEAEQRYQTQLRLLTNGFKKKGV